MGWTHGQNEREITEKMWDKAENEEVKSTAKMGWLPVIARIADYERQCREKANNRERWEQITKVAVQRSNEWPVSPIQNGNERKKMFVGSFS